MPRKFSPEESERLIRAYHRPPLENRLWLHESPHYPEERKVRLGTNKIFTAPSDIGEEAALKLCGRLLEDSDYDLLLNETGMVKTPDGRILAVLLKQRLLQDLIDAVRPVVRKAAHRKVIAGNRGVAAGTGMQPRRRKDGTVGKIKGVPILEDLSEEDYKRLAPAKDGTFGFSARSIRGGQVYPCRLTAYSGALPSELKLMSELAAAVNDVFRTSIVGYEWNVQARQASRTSSDWLLRTPQGTTPFTTITCNNRWRTAAHIDAGDFKDGFGSLCSMGEFGGCDLVFPRYRTAVRYLEGDVLLANVHEVHGNTPLLTPEGKVPLPGREPERLVCVFYYQEHMDECESTPEKEHEFINRREKGDKVRKAKAKVKAKAKAKGAGR
jgi:hypothetical protein